MSFVNPMSRQRGSNKVVYASSTGPTNAAKRPNTFSFNNQSTFRKQPRLMPTVLTPRCNGIPNGLKTPIISNTTLFGMQEEEEGHGPNEEIMDFESFGAEEFFETNEFSLGQRPCVNEKQRNNFSSPVNIVQDENKLMNDPYHAYKSGQSARFVNEPFTNTKATVNSTPLRQTILSKETANGLGFKINENEKKVSKVVQEHIVKPFPKWSPNDAPTKSKQLENKEQNFPRILTVTVDKFLSCSKTFDCGKVIFELFGILDRVWDALPTLGKKIQLKSQKMRQNMTCTFYETDRPLPKLVAGQWHRCIMLLRSNGDHQCLTIRSATLYELKCMDQLVTSSSKSMAMLLKSHME